MNFIHVAIFIVLLFRFYLWNVGLSLRDLFRLYLRVVCTSNLLIPGRFVQSERKFKNYVTGFSIFNYCW